MFNLRLSQHWLFRSATGYWEDISNILALYNLGKYLEEFVQNGIFPSKMKWKRITSTAIWSQTKQEWAFRISYPEFDCFRIISPDFGYIKIWHFARRNPKSLDSCLSVAKMITYSARLNETCKKCNTYLGDTSLSEHLILECSETRQCIFRMMQRINDRHGARVVSFINSLNNATFVKMFLGVENTLLLQGFSEIYDDIMCTLYMCVHFLWLNYKN